MSYWGLSGRTRHAWKCSSAEKTPACASPRVCCAGAKNWFWQADLEKCYAITSDLDQYIFWSKKSGMREVNVRNICVQALTLPLYSICRGPSALLPPADTLNFPFFTTSSTFRSFSETRKVSAPRWNSLQALRSAWNWEMLWCAIWPHFLLCENTTSLVSKFLSLMAYMFWAGVRFWRSEQDMLPFFVGGCHVDTRWKLHVQQSACCSDPALILTSISACALELCTEYMPCIPGTHACMTRMSCEPSDAQFVVCHWNSKSASPLLTLRVCGFNRQGPNGATVITYGKSFPWTAVRYVGMRYSSELLLKSQGDMMRHHLWGHAATEYICIHALCVFTHMCTM